MNELKLSGKEKTMTSREIADLTGKQHFHVVRDIKKMMLDLGRENDASNFGYEFLDIQNRRQYGYMLPYDETICLLTGYDPKARMAVIKRWQELEAKTAPAFQIPTTLSGALRLAAEQAEVIEVQAAQIAAAAPALEFIDRYVESDTGSMGFREVCKLLKVKEPEFRAFLHDKQIMYKLGGNWSPYAAHIDAGRFEVKTGTANEHAFTQAKFTAKGVKWVAGEWSKFQLEELL